MMIGLHVKVDPETHKMVKTLAALSERSMAEIIKEVLDGVDWQKKVMAELQNSLTEEEAAM